MGIKKYIKASLAGAIKEGLNEYGELHRRLDDVCKQIKLEHEKNRLLDIFLSLPDKVLSFFYCGQEVKIFLPDANIDGIQEQILRTKTFYEIEFLETLYEFVGVKDGQVIDVGANIGNHTLFFLKICDFSECYAFEPNPAVAHILKRNIEINDLNEKVKFFDKGVGAEKSVMYLGTSPQDNLGATKLHKEGIKRSRTDVMALDDLNLQNVDLIKIDVEGMALEVLRGARKTITQNKPTLFVELFDDEFDEGKIFLETLGYELKRSLAWGNYIFAVKA